MQVCVPGSCGFVGSVLVPELLAAGHTVVGYDNLSFGNHIPWHPRFRLVEGDVRDSYKFAFAVHGCDAVIHLACISNDPSAELDPALTRAVNLDSFAPVVHACKTAGAGRFVFASSSSVYGISDEPDVTETHPLRPLTDYSRYKGECEEILRSYQSEQFTTVVVRPATVAGVSPRMRFDLAVNALTNCAVNSKTITVHGGTQKRPSVHIIDLCDLYRRLLDLPKHIVAGQTFNAGRENATLAELAAIVREVVQQEMGFPVAIETTETNDNRSYHISSLRAHQVLGWHPYHSVADAVRELCAAFRRGVWGDSFDDRYFNVKVLKAITPPTP